MMDDLISRKDALDAIVGCTNCETAEQLRAYVTKHSLDNGWIGGVLEAFDAVEDLPSAQPEIIRCKDCKWSDWYDVDGYKYCYCIETGASGRTADDFCSYAEREKDEQ